MSELLVCKLCGAKISKKGVIEAYSRENDLLDRRTVIEELREKYPFIACPSDCGGFLRYESMV